MGYDHLLSDDEKRELLRIARASLREYLATGRMLPGAPHKKTLLEPGGAFVSLHHGGKLRGCIGTFADNTEIYRTIQEMAIAAGTRDPRFDQLHPDDLAKVEIEVSVLSGLKPVTNPDEVEIGRHGLHISRGRLRGVLLPQVATEHGWDRETFLTHTCRKAGLPDDAWQLPGTLIETFTAQVFSEQELSRTSVVEEPKPAE